MVLGDFIIFMLCFVSAVQDRKIEELRQSLTRYKKVQDMVMSVQGRKGEHSLHIPVYKWYVMHRS